MSIEIHDIPQGTPEWHALRAGRITASELSSVIAGGQGKTRATYMRKLAGEIITGNPADSFSNAHMERGHEQEPEARRLYSFAKGEAVQEVGFISNGRLGYSPDGLIGDDGAVEIKTKLAHLQIDLLLKDKFPTEHRAQCQGGLMIAEREWIDLICYSPGLPPLIKRAYRDEEYIRTLRDGVDRFLEELDFMVHEIKKMGVAA